MRDVRTYLQDQEPVMIQIYTTTFKESLNFLVITLPAVNSIFATIILVRSPSNHELRVRNNFKRIRTRLYNDKQSVVNSKLQIRERVSRSSLQGP